MTDGQETHAGPDTGADSESERDSSDRHDTRMDGVAPIPASIVKARTAIMRSLTEAVKKTQRNAHGGYQFASTDDIYGLLVRRMGDVGLLCEALELRADIERVEKDGKTSQWLRAVYQFVWATETDTWTDPRARRTVAVLITGPQTFQAAQSFAEKAYLRSSFKIATGDVDLDAMPEATTEEGQLSLTGHGGKRKSSSAAKKDGTTKVFNDLKAAVASANSLHVLEQIPDLYADEIGTLPRQWHQLFEDDYQARREDLSAAENDRMMP